jgi:hypothetical protein
MNMSDSPTTAPQTLDHPEGNGCEKDVAPKCPVRDLSANRREHQKSGFTGLS